MKKLLLLLLLTGMAEILMAQGIESFTLRGALGLNSRLGAPTFSTDIPPLLFSADAKLNDFPIAIGYQWGFSGKEWDRHEILPQSSRKHFSRGIRLLYYPIYKEKVRVHVGMVSQQKRNFFYSLLPPIPRFNSFKVTQWDLIVGIEAKVSDRIGFYGEIGHGLSRIHAGFSYSFPVKKQESLPIR
ncbi:hypothetical protein QWY31_13775 [Cytophagales bacterium LB-30]|uniref:MipA/OmpV family protein n=1 Tax=Shiella aurantiaca TaxID=3058365 RepID=A0ABT8F7V4_9BACT|nr:hypothetical protein [Shiella aurantiaca]MDN4166573.1 hypothetical protein [Shiella aurantiaca]